MSWALDSLTAETLGDVQVQLHSSVANDTPDFYKNLHSQHIIGYICNRNKIFFIKYIKYKIIHNIKLYTIPTK